MYSPWTRSKGRLRIDLLSQVRAVRVGRGRRDLEVGEATPEGGFDPEDSVGPGLANALPPPPPPPLPDLATGSDRAGSVRYTGGR